MWYDKPEYKGTCPMCNGKDSLYKDSETDNVVKCKMCDFVLVDKTLGGFLMKSLENKTEKKD